jgi:hypothetical protein
MGHVVVGRVQRVCVHIKGGGVKRKLCGRWGGKASDGDGEGAHVFNMLFEYGAVCEGVEVCMGRLDTGHKERACIAGEELVGAGAHDHGKLAWLE